jgi:hypothetical protein
MYICLEWQLQTTKIAGRLASVLIYIWNDMYQEQIRHVTDKLTYSLILLILLYNILIV